MKMSKRAWYANQVARQRAWIESCESNGRSYTGRNGQAIREADEAELRRLESTLRSFGRCGEGDATK